MGQKTTNPHEGIETLYNGTSRRCLHASSESARKERIPVRGLKQSQQQVDEETDIPSEKNESLCGIEMGTSSIESARTNLVRKERILVRGSQPS